MANEALYVVFAALVIIITIMIWNRKVDSFSNYCGNYCKTVIGSNEHDRCLQKCTLGYGHKIMKYGGQNCSDDVDCQTGQLCVKQGFYMGVDGNEFPESNSGTCMDENDPGVVQWKSQGLPNREHANGTPTSLCVTNCTAQGKSLSKCSAICSYIRRPPGRPDIPGHPSKCMSKCLSEGNSKVNCQALCDPAPPSRLGDAAQYLKGKGPAFDAAQYLKGKGPAVSCASRCISEGSQYPGGDPGNWGETAAQCRSLCGLPSPPSACMRRCRSERGTQAECQGICDSPTQPDDDHTYPTWAFSMTGEITPTKVENFGPESCKPGYFWNAYAKRGRGNCQPFFQGTSSAWSVNNQTPDPDAEVSIPGTTLRGYGVGYIDPKDKPTGVTISSDPGYKKK
uniref:Uncharacterized protein n=1 Tax=Marseillevirus LCMAC101 TaxID=2506602 RepID=A0A481YQR9_9VIRU|nr:MAG: hypothetical protein LCMAC101_01880 [Marseillevirus LCMAC101]